MISQDIHDLARFDFFRQIYDAGNLLPFESSSTASPLIVAHSPAAIEVVVVPCFSEAAWRATVNKHDHAADIHNCRLQLR